jgi:GNAT superfamily N-acetyltransferase
MSAQIKLRDYRVTGNSNRAIVAGPADIELLVNVMVLAFAADPVARWMYRDPQRYLRYFGPFVRAFGGKAFSNGMAWRIEGNLGAAFWLAPSAEVDGDAVARILDESVPPGVLADVNAMFGEMAAYHPTTPHWYLPLIGVEPDLHNKGLGSALMKEGLKRCDEEHLPAYLEYTNPKSEAFYRALGFEAKGVIRVGDSPPMVPMLRPAR